MTDRQERIRQRAHAIWEQAGRPDGSHQQHWDQATAEIDAETAAQETASRPKPPAAKEGTKPKARPRKA
ncbi:hypothetical protein X759_35440 [Mesorhizobium sp. LSHC420B00]|uniref:DUF2934 domain-containing protein n=1 Tax=unclassified Mesorhizobium TaxID=325217 RepID=UPI0003CDE031|nr:DUF2934 domain-containing protein [Mesorhizobium sp. LSHC420B00]ESX61091.1 hypothetical protein X759_35440 [Mesorhizobium sp. LSHC420B00]